MYKKDDRLPYQKSRFFIANKVGLSLDVKKKLEKNLKHLLYTAYMLVVRFIIS